MFNTAKYIIVENDAGCECPIVFSHLLIHRHVARGNGHVVSAGFVDFSVTPVGTGHEPHFEITATCYGESESLKIKSRGAEDDKLIEKYILNK